MVSAQRGRDCTLLRRHLDDEEPERRGVQPTRTAAGLTVGRSTAADLGSEMPAGPLTDSARGRHPFSVKLLK